MRRRGAEWYAGTSGSRKHYLYARSARRQEVQVFLGGEAYYLRAISSAAPARTATAPKIRRRKVEDSIGLPNMKLKSLNQ